MVEYHTLEAKGALRLLEDPLLVTATAEIHSGEPFMWSQLIFLGITGGSVKTWPLRGR